MKKIIFLVLLMIGANSYCQNVIEYPYSAKFGSVQARDSAVFGNIPLVTDNTYQLVARSDGTIGYYGEEPTISCNLSVSLVEYNTNNTITITGIVTNSISATFSNGYVSDVNNSTGTAFTLTANNYTALMAIDFDPTELTYGSNTYISSIDWVSGSNSGTITCSKTLPAVYPVFYGISSTDYSSNLFGVYEDLTKLVAAEGDKVVNLSGTGYIYYLMPVTWTDTELSSILDHNGFPQLPGNFTRIATGMTITSTGLTPNWTKEYVLYQYNTTVTSVDWDGWIFYQ